jgi:hypothetical protein
MRLAWVFGFLVCLVSISASSGFAEQAGPLHRRVLEAVKGLEKPVSYTETKIPLSELVQKVAADTGAPLTAAREVADEPVAVVVKDLSARELLEQLADLLDYRWVRKGPEGAWRYEIWQDAASQRREEALRRQMTAGVAAKLCDRLRQWGTIARLPQSVRQAIKDDFERRTKELEKLRSDQQQAFCSSRAGYELYRRNWAIETVARPVARVQAELLGALSPEQWAALWTNRELVFSSRPAAGEFPLPEEIARQFRAARPSESRLLLDEPSPSEEDRQTGWATAAGYRVTVRLEASQHRADASLGLQASTQPILGAGAREGFSLPPGDWLDVNVSAYDWDPPFAEDTLERRASLEKDPLLARWAAFRPAAKPSGQADGSGAGGSWHGCELLPELAKASGANFISDAYWGTNSVSRDMLSTDPQPLYRWLDALYLPGQRWDHRGSVIRLRSRTWFLERPREVPLRFVRRWSQSYFDRGGLSLDDYLDAAAGLKESHLQALEDIADLLIQLRWLPRVAEELRELYPARHVLRFYASLSPEQRQQLAAGRALPYSEITPAERRLFFTALDAISIREHCEPLASSTLVHWGEAGFTAASGRYTWVEIEEGGRALRPEPPLGPLVRSGASGIAPDAGHPIRPAALPRPPDPPTTWRVPGRSGRPAIPWDLPMRASLTRIELELSAGPDLREGYALPIASFP